MTTAAPEIYSTSATGSVLRDVASEPIGGGSSSSVDPPAFGIIYTRAEPEAGSLSPVEAITYIVGHGVVETIEQGSTAWVRTMKQILSRMSSSSASLSADELVIAIDDDTHPLPQLATRIRSLHRNSGLTWEQIARMFAVSRRSVHSWARGGRMNARNAERLATIERVVAVHRRDSSVETREALLRTNEGPSVFQSLISTAQAEATEQENVLLRLLASTTAGGEAYGSDTTFENIDWPTPNSDNG